MRQIMIRLQPDDYATLRQLADREDRPVDRQAAYLVRQALTGTPSRPTTDDRQPVGVGADRPAERRT